MSNISPRHAFEDNMRPADLQMRLYRLLENEEILTTGSLVTSFRMALGTVPEGEDVMVIVNDIFVGMIREAAACPPTVLKRAALKSLLRQAVVASCTALDAFLPALLREHLPLVIQARGRDFYPQDKELQEFLADLTFDLAETLRLIGDTDASLYIANKILGLVKFKYLSSRKGIFATGVLLSVDKPWDKIAMKLTRDKKDLMNVIEELAARRNDIVHRADRPQADPSADIQDISYSWTRHTVDTVNAVCLALDEIVNERMTQLRVNIPEHG